MMKLIEDYFPVLLLLGFTILFFGAIIVGIVIEDGNNLERYRACVEAGMQYVEGNCVLAPKQ